MSKTYSPIFIISLIIFSTIFIILIISIFECSSYKISLFNINSKKIKNKIRIVFFSDLHDKLYSFSNNRLVNDIVSLKPDMIIIGGDIIDFSAFNSFFNNVKYENAIDFIKKLSSEYYKYNKKDDCSFGRIFFLSGNHELRLKKKSVNDKKLKDIYDMLFYTFDSNNIMLLDDKTYNLHDNITVSGLSLYDGYYVKSFDKSKIAKHITNDVILSKVGIIDESKFNIIAFHKPDYASDLINFGFDLVLSGHNHGGLIKFNNNKAIFSPDLSLFPKYNYGHYYHKNKDIIVTSGIGEHFLKIRVNNRPEICVIDINGTD